VCRRFDLRREAACESAVEGREVVFNMACDMGGMGFIEPNKALCMRNVLINTHLIEAARHAGVASYFYASSACVYPARLQGGHARALAETDAYPAESEPGYGWEKLFSEQVCQHYHHDFGLDVHIGRFHTIYGPHGSWTGGREKVPAALCRKVASGGVVEVWGDGQQERSLLYVDDAIDGILRLAETGYHDPVNIGAIEAHTVNGLLDTIELVAGKPPAMRVYDSSKPQGVRGRSSDNTLMHSLTGWEPTTSLEAGIERTYRWVAEQVACSTGTK
jgi:nucleoside-diphosphate-sugar epimerase